MKLIGPQVVEKFHSFYGTQRFITAFTRVHHLSPILSHIKTVLCHPTHPRSDFWNEKVRGDRDGGRERDIFFFYNTGFVSNCSGYNSPSSTAEFVSNLQLPHTRSGIRVLELKCLRENGRLHCFPVPVISSHCNHQYPSLPSDLRIRVLTFVVFFPNNYSEMWPYKYDGSTISA